MQYGIKIPKEIRDYKEKLILGLTARQLIASALAIGVCVPLYLFGVKFLGDELTSWLVILIALPLMAIGFIKKNGMPFEKYAKAVLLHQAIYPQKTNFKSVNYWRKLQTQAEKEDSLLYDAKKMKKYNMEASLERAYLLDKAEEENVDIDIESEELITVRKPKPKKTENSSSNSKQKKEAVVKKSKAQRIAEEVAERQKANPEYLLSGNERKMVQKWNKEQEAKKLAERKKGKKAVVKKNNSMKKRRNAKTNIPKSSQDDLPYLADYDEGMFEVEANKFSKCYKLVDINYLTAKEEEQAVIFSQWVEFLNSFSEDLTFAIYIDNRIVSIKEQEEQIYSKLCGDEYDMHRKEWNKILKKQIMAGRNDIQKEKYITVTIDADTPYEALLRFRKLDMEILNNLRRFGVDGRVMSTEERLSLLHDKMRRGREGDFNVSFNFLKQQGLSSKDYIAPSSFWWKPKNHFAIEDTYYRCMYLTNLPSSLTDEILRDLTDFDFPIITSLNIQPMAQEKAIRMVRKQLTGMEANIIEAQKKAIKAGYDPSMINHDLAHSQNEAMELLDALQTKNQKLFYVSILMMIGADSVEELDRNTEALQSKARSKPCQVQMLDNQQRVAMKICLPMGVPTKDKLYVERTLTSEATGIFIPFTTQEIWQQGGYFYGLNQNSNNVILCNRSSFKTPSGFVLGSSGSGKSFTCKQEILCVLMADSTTSVIIVDPENEYKSLAIAFGGTVINLSSSSDSHINPMAMSEDYGLDDEDDSATTPMEKKKDKALKKKSGYIMSIIDCMLSRVENGISIGGVSPTQKTVIDNAIRNTYQEYLANDFKGKVPTLEDFQRELDKLRDESADANDLAVAVAYYTTGSMNLFSHETNIDLDNRFITFSIRDLGKELKQIGMLITMDFIWDRMISNFLNMHKTYLYVDEIHTLFQNQFSEVYIQQFFKRGRKFGLTVTGITQNIRDLLRSEVSRTMVSNSDFLILLSQKSDDLSILKELLHLSDPQCRFVEMADYGRGLIFAEKTIIPFKNDFPQDSYLYNLMTTKFGEEGVGDVGVFLEEVRKVMELEESLHEKEAVEVA